MWVLFATALLIASPALGEEDICEKSGWEICDSGLHFKFPTNEKEMEEACPIALDESNCRLEHATKCESERLDEITANVEVLEDICRKGSSLNEAIGPNLGCITENVIKECDDKVPAVHRAYRDYLNSTAKGFSEQQWAKVACMSYGYDVACVLHAVSEPCGSTVKNAILEVANRIDWMEKRTLCSRSTREEIVKDIPILEISITEKLLLEELLLDI